MALTMILEKEPYDGLFVGSSSCPVLVSYLGYVRRSQEGTASLVRLGCLLFL